MDMCIGEGRFDNVRSAAYWCKRSLDISPRYFDLETAANDYGKFLEEKHRNPMIADMAMHLVVKKNPISDFKNFESNLTLLEKVPEVDTLVKSVDEKIFETYPRTYDTRRCLIAEDRVSLTSDVKPKLRGLKKLMLKLKASL